METTRATIIRTVFHNPDNGFTIVLADVRTGGVKQRCSLKGTLPGIRPDMELEVTGDWSTDRYGRYFKVTEWKEVLPSSVKGIVAYLASGLIKGIGEKYAKAIVKTFGEDTLNVLDNAPERLQEVPGIAKKRAATIIECIKEQREIRNIMIFLKEYGISNSVAAKIYKQYGNDSVEMLKENPYRLSEDILGIGFKKADEVASRLGIERYSLDRIKAGVRFALEDQVKKGHTYFPEDLLTEYAASGDVLGIEPGSIAEGLSHLEFDGDVIRDNGKVYLTPFYYAESGVASRMTGLLDKNVSSDVILSCMDIQEKTGCTYEDKQVDAILTAQREPVMILTGLPGTGKTTVSNAIITALEMQKMKVILAAPTGRAAKRLSEASGRPAKTIHRLLEYSNGEFSRNERNPLEAGAVLVDESSMIDIILMNNLLKAIPKSGCKLILVGDTDQLPSVGAGNVLKDLIDSGCIPTVRLTKIFRQALSSQIVTGAHAINAGRMPEQFGRDLVFVEDDDKNRIQERITLLVQKTLPVRLGYSPDDIQVLSPMKRDFDPIGTTQLNRILQETLNPNPVKIQRGLSEFRLGDRVMQMKNNYDLDVFNGDTGKITGVDTEEDQITVSFNGEEKVFDRADFDNLSLAYACTVHKSQGSEYPVVIFPVHESQYIMLERNLLYTAITRAKKLCILIGTKKALRTMISRQNAVRRFTALDERIREQHSPAGQP